MVDFGKNYQKLQGAYILNTILGNRPSPQHGSGYVFPDKGGWDGKSFVPRAAARAEAKAAKSTATATKPAAAKPAAAKPTAALPTAAQPTAAKPATKQTSVSPALSAIRAALPSFGNISEQQVQELSAQLSSVSQAAGVQHRLGQVCNRSACNISTCRNANAVLGCQTCGIHLCSPECYNAHAFDGVELGGKICAVFMEKSKLSQRMSQPNKGRKTAAAAATRA